MSVSLVCLHYPCYTLPYTPITFCLYHLLSAFWVSVFLVLVFYFICLFCLRFLLFTLHSRPWSNCSITVHVNVIYCTVVYYCPVVYPPPSAISENVLLFFFFSFWYLCLLLFSSSPHSLSLFLFFPWVSVSDGCICCYSIPSIMDGII